MTRETTQTLWILIALGIGARIVAWWFAGGYVYPDEIFQQVEPAHYLRTGVAWMPWEFQRGVRSWIVPGLYAALFEVLSWLGLTGFAALRAVALHNALLTALMIPAGYRIGAALCAGDGEWRERAGLWAALFTALLPPLLFYSPRTLIGTTCMVPLSWGYVYWLEARAATRPVTRSLLLCGLFFGISGALRLTCGFYMLVALGDLVWRYRARGVGLLVAGATPALVIVGAVDLVTWGWPFHAAVEHLRYNFFEGQANNYEQSPWYFYLTGLHWQRLGWLAPVAWLVVASGLRRSWPLLLSLLPPVIALSMFLNKQERFLMYTWPLMAVAFGIGCAAIQRYRSTLQRSPSRTLGAAVAAVVLASSLQGALALPWADRQPVFSAQSFVGRQPGATGLLLDHRQHENGGYLVLDRNIPQVELTRKRLDNPLYNYVLLTSEGAELDRLRERGWKEVARFQEVRVLARPR